jgi:hypothetical protein
MNGRRTLAKDTPMSPKGEEAQSTPSETAQTALHKNPKGEEAQSTPSETAQTALHKNPKGEEAKRTRSETVHRRLGKRRTVAKDAPMSPKGEAQRTRRETAR